MSTATTMERAAPTALQVFRDRLLSRRIELTHALEGSGISPDRFIRTAVTAAQLQPELISDVSFPSLWNALLKACRDRLLPDGKQGAIVPYKRQAQWIPMYRGLLDRFEQSGHYKWVGAGLHREDDKAFDVWLDENGQHFLHRPGPGFGKVIETYAAAITKSGAFFVSVINEPDMLHIRNVSRTKAEDTPWNQWPDQMRLKSAIRRLCKILPMPQALDDLLDEESNEIDDPVPLPMSDQRGPKLGRPRGAASALRQFAGEPDEEILDTKILQEQAAADEADERGQEGKRSPHKKTESITGGADDGQQTS